MTTNQNGNVTNLNIPEWINENYFVDILRTDQPKFNKILNFKRCAATAPGENYTSIMVRVSIAIELADGVKKEVSYIVKTTLDPNCGSSNLLKSLKFFPREMLMYSDILPKFVALYKSVGIDIQFGPKCLHIEELPERITLVFEDLQRRSFKNMDRLTGIDSDHTTQFLRKLAAFHAASVVYKDYYGEFDELLRKGLFDKNNREYIKQTTSDFTASLVKAMHQWSLPKIDQYIAKIPDPDKYFDEIIRLYTPIPGDFNVLNHGDCWTNNFMFSHNSNGEIEETLFVDFQLGFWGSAAHDLWYFILTSTHANIQDFDRYIQIYHDNLMVHLKLLKYTHTPPTLKQLHIQLLRHSFWAHFTIYRRMPIILYPSCPESNLTTFTKRGPEGVDYREKVFTSSIFVKAMHQVYPFLDKKGILDL